MEKSYEELLGIHQGYEMMVGVLTGSQDNIALKEFRKGLKNQKNHPPRNFQA